MNKNCFVIMPFGIKDDHEGNKVNFDKIYTNIIKEPIIEMGIDCLRCDEISKAGMIHKDMFNHIYSADIAIVDISVLNPNVFYEVGMRHSLKKSITILLKRKNTRIPFNINGMRLIEYDENDALSITNTKIAIKKFVDSGIRERQTDSPVHDAIANLVVSTKEEIITKSEIFSYPICEGSSKIIGIRTGSIDKVKDVDIWVNSENTNMQMATFFSGSLSGTIRYLGAKKDITQNVIEDTIANELERLMGTHNTVNPGVVIPTDPGDLLKTHNVKKLFHAASVVGHIGKGYIPIVEIERCIAQALNLTKAFNDMKSIIFPLFGTGKNRGDVEIIAPLLFKEVLDYFDENPDSAIEKVFFIVLKRKELEICKHVLVHLLNTANEK
jgi:O-acetyl-ADP-ribose deacetylase (regulator of RNase III)